MFEQKRQSLFPNRRLALTGVALLSITLGVDKCGASTPAPTPDGTCGMTTQRVGQIAFSAKQLPAYTGDERNHLVDGQKKQLTGDGKVAANAITSIVVAPRTGLKEESVTTDTMGALGNVVREDLTAAHASVTVGGAVSDGPGGEVIVRTYAPYNTCAALGQLVSVPR